MGNFFKHIKLVNSHKWKVFKLCCKAGIPVQGIFHDLSKYSITEFKESVRYYEGTVSPLLISKNQNGYSKAWLHHKGRNKHHFEYWFDVCTLDKAPIMPYKYAVELICDTISAGKTYLGYGWTPEKQIEYFNNRKDRDYINVKIQDFIVEVYKEITEEGIDKVIRKERLKKLYDEIVLSPFRYTVFLDGTCNKSKWRDEFIPLLDENVSYYNPYSEKYDETVEEKNLIEERNSKFVTCVVTSDTKGYLSLIKTVNLSNKTPNRILFCVIKKGFTKDELKSLEEVKKMLKNNKVLVFDNLKDLAKYINENI